MSEEIRDYSSEGLFKNNSSLNDFITNTDFLEDTRQTDLDHQILSDSDSDEHDVQQLVIRNFSDPILKINCIDSDIEKVPDSNLKNEDVDGLMRSKRNSRTRKRRAVKRKFYLHILFLIIYLHYPSVYLYDYLSVSKNLLDHSLINQLNNFFCNLLKVLIFMTT